MQPASLHRSSHVLVSLLLLLLPRTWSSCVAFVIIPPPRRLSSTSTDGSHTSRAAKRAESSSLGVLLFRFTTNDLPERREVSCRRCRALSLAFEGQQRQDLGRKNAYVHTGYVGSLAAGTTWSTRSSSSRQVMRRRRDWRKRNRQRLRAKSNDEEGVPNDEVVDAEISDDISEIMKADRESVVKRRAQPEESGAAPQKVVKKTASKRKTVSAPDPAPASFSFAGSGFASLEDAAASGEFVDLSDGRKSCLKRVEREGRESDGNPPKGSKIKVHYKMKVLGGENIASSGDDRSRPFEFRLGRWPSEATHGWDKAVSAMHKGEIATLICGPQYAFGETGAPPRIPPDATVEAVLELVDWLDLAATYNAVPGKVETDKEMRDRWGEEIADGTSPLKDDAGLRKKMQEEMAAKAGNTPPNVDHRGKKIYDVNSKEAREIMAKQKTQGYTPDFSYVEKVDSLDLYIPVPEGTRAKDVTVEIHPDRMLVVVKGKGVVTKGHFYGKVALDGCYWLMSDLSLDPPGEVALGTQDDEVRYGPVYRGETCVQVFLEKRKPFDTLWENVYRPSEDDGGSDADDAPVSPADKEAAAAVTD